jgi:hypothetical protein
MSTSALTNNITDIQSIDIEKLKRIQKESFFLIDKYPDHILLYIHTKHKNSVKLTKSKYLLINSMILKDFLKILTSKLNIDKNHVLYFKINNTVVDDLNITIEELYNKYINNDDNISYEIGKLNFVILEICRYTKYINKAISLLTFGIL